MPPTPDCSTCTPTSSVPSLASAPWMASDRTLHVGLDAPAAAGVFSPASRRLEQLIERLARGRGLARFAALAGAIFRDFAGARFGFHHHEFVAGFRRRRKTQNFDRRGRDRRLSRSRRGRSASRRTRPHSEPATTMSPTFSVPRCTSTVATGPRPLSSLASITAPSAVRSGLALRSSSSACSRIGFFQLVEIGALGGGDFHGDASRRPGLRPGFRAAAVRS